MMLVTDLPDDILYGIFPHLTALEFLHFTSCSKVLLLHRDDTTFWHALTRKTFRIPSQPLLKQARWQSLYKKLLKQTRLYTWGNNECENLGRNGGFPRDPNGQISSGWPGQVQIDDPDIGIIADVQCGGWCTTVLNSIGNVFMFGLFNGSMRIHPLTTAPKKLLFPPAYPQNSNRRYEPSTAIQQFSTGRSTVLGLSDDDKVWSWTSDVGVLIKPLHVDIREHKVEKVVAGWECSSMYVRDVGIVYWASERESDFLDGGRQENLAIADGLLIDTVTIPGTAFRRRSSDRFDSESLDARIGEITNHIVLENHIVFTTHLNKVFSYPNVYPMPAIDFTEPVELTTFLQVQTSASYQILDLQGSFRRFAVFNSDGSIWLADSDYLNAFHNAQTSTEVSRPPLPLPTLYEPNPQQARTISIAFGDHHCHALHEDGTLTSWGSQSRACGALGLGDEGRELLRGVQVRPWSRDQFLPISHARTVWFEPLMEKWLEDVFLHFRQEPRLQEPRLLEQANGRLLMNLFGDYYEKQGSRWEADVCEEGDLGAYFVLKVAAAGWSSAALVLVDDQKAELARRKHIVTSASSDTESAAEYEYGDSPFDMVEMSLRSIKNWVWGKGRYFLGLTERDANNDIQSGEEVYSWSNNLVPLDEILSEN